MDKLEIINLYENSNKNRIEEFTSKTNSTLKVNIDKKKMQKELEESRRKKGIVIE